MSPCRLFVRLGLALTTLAPLSSLAGPDAQCLGAWPKQKSPPAKATEACIDNLLQHAYFGPADAEALTLDPSPDSPVEVQLLTADLQAIKGHLAGCPLTLNGEENWRCVRIHEFVDGMIARKNSTLDQGGLESLVPALTKVLKGEVLTLQDLEQEGDARFTPLGLWKLRNAAYARHGFAFKKADLNRFFYEPRPEGVQDLAGAETAKDLLPLPKGTRAKVDLTPVDGQNIRLIAQMEGKLTRAAKKRRK